MQPLPATLDDSFDGDGIQVLALTPNVDYIHDMTVLDDGKILAIGAVNDRFGIMRFNADMTLDSTFGSGGGTQVDFGAGKHASAFAIDSSGRIYVGGQNRLARFTADGLLDTTFGSNGSVVDDHSSPIYDIQIEADGNILTPGRNGNLANARRWSPEGVNLRSFSRDVYGSGDDWVRGVISRDDGDVLVLGSYAYSYSDQRFGVVRFNRDGGHEADYDANIGASDTDFVNSVLQLPDNKFLLIGRSYGQLAFTRHLPDGARDTSFPIVELPVINAQDHGYRATLAADGKILISGYADNGVNNDLTVVRLNQDGSVDDTFGTNGSVSFDISVQRLRLRHRLTG